uniref:Uncharacterized protein n=1 Tax=Wuchereria bancrofti TaxID=6293 RepID=A0AAF5Q561_WUCBA
MSASIIVRAKLVKENLEELLDEIRQIDLTPSDQKSPIEILCQQYETRLRIVKEKLMRLEKYVGTLEKNQRQMVGIHSTNSNLALKRLTRSKEHRLTECRSVVNLPQLSLPTFSDDPKTWKEFWSNFETSVHSQNIPDI